MFHHRSALPPGLVCPAAASSDGTARVWDLDIGDCVLMLEGHAGPITDMAITSGVLAACLRCLLACLWEAKGEHAFGTVGVRVSICKREGEEVGQRPVQYL